jgi:hypothetical protein
MDNLKIIVGQGFSRAVSMQNQCGFSHWPARNRFALLALQPAEFLFHEQKQYAQAEACSTKLQVGAAR